MDNIVEGIGIASSILITVMFIPQIVHVYVSKDTNALNYTFLNLNLLASILGLFYSIYFIIVPMIIVNISAGLFSILVLSMKYLNNNPLDTSNVV